MGSTFEPGVVAPAPPSLEAAWLLFDGSELWVTEDPGGAAALARPRELPDRAHYLGTLDGRPCFTARVAQERVPDAVPLGLRSVFGALGEALFVVAGRAVQILEWDRTHRFCGACGGPTVPVPGERALRCEQDQLNFYPRVAPAVICVVHRGPEALLARARTFTKPFYSTLAGFVEPGETLEEAVRREVREEVGVELAEVAYFGSQPWPFPNSLMVGFTARWASGEIRLDEKEILDARWFRYDQLPNVPPPISISRRLIDWWIDQARALS